jgi:uncharacterized membrane protein YfcA
MSVLEIAILVAVGCLSGSVNAVVGGGTFFTFPVLLALGVPPVAANATNTVALWPASLMAARAYIVELRSVKQKLPLRAAIAVLGGVIGAFLLLASSDEVFSYLIPWLIAIATTLFAFSKPIVRHLSKLSSGANAALMVGLELVFAIYGGYFGAGIGILLMAALAVMGETDPQVANAQKNLLSGLINGAAVVVFAAQGAVVWSYALVVMVGAVAGGYFGARAARHIPAKALRFCVIGMGCILALIYFQRAYFP